MLETTGQEEEDGGTLNEHHTKQKDVSSCM